MFYQTHSQSVDDSFALAQELKYNELATSNNDSAITVEANDSIECGTLILLWSNMKINADSPVENTQQKPIRFKLGKNKFPKVNNFILNYIYSVNFYLKIKGMGKKF